MLDSLSKKQKIIFFIIIFIMILVIIYYIYSTLYSNNFSYFSDNTNIITTDLVENYNINNIIKTDSYTPYNESLNSIIVYVCGAVKESKVVTLKENSRICDAIDAVGGLTNEADLSNINLAYILEDGEKIYIPKKGEESQSSNLLSSYNSKKNNSKININKATQTELETIPGVGPSTALKIINYREDNGKFNSIEDIKNVSGIGDAKFENIKNYISIK